MVTKPFTIVGFPRSGTKYTARLLYENGIVCSHEHLHPVDERQLPPLTNNVVTWVPIQWMQHYVLGHTTLLHLIRDPRDVIRSWGVFQKINRNYLYELTGTQDFEMCWWTYNRIIASKAKFVFRVEDLVENWDTLMEFIGYPGHPLTKTIPTDTHSYRDFPEYHTIQPEPRLMKTLRRRYGYE